MKSIFKIIIIIAILVIAGLIVFSSSSSDVGPNEDATVLDTNNQDVEDEDIPQTGSLVRNILAQASQENQNQNQVWTSTQMSEPTLVFEILQNESAENTAYQLMQAELGISDVDMQSLWSELTSQTMVGEWETVVEMYQLGSTSQLAPDQEIPEGMMVLEIPLIHNTAGDIGPFGCGVYMNYEAIQIPETTGVLSEVYNKLFNELPAEPSDDSGGIQNVVATQTSLNYESVEIIDGEAKLYLTGQIMGNHCADPALQGQIEAAAFQFETVESLSVFVNDEIFNWCELDQSDGEGPCPENPQLWQVNRGEEIYN